MVSPIAKQSYTTELRSQAPRRVSPRAHAPPSPQDAPNPNTHLVSRSQPKRKATRASTSPYQVPTRLPLDDPSSSTPSSPTLSDPQSLPSDSSSTGKRSRSRGGGARLYQDVSERKHYLDTSPDVLAYSAESVTCAWCRKHVRLDNRGDAQYYLGFFLKHLGTQQCRAAREEIVKTLVSLGQVFIAHNTINSE